MSLKLKIILGVMLLIAGFVVSRIGINFNQGVKTANLALHTFATPTPSENPLTIDTDKDGLSDRDEIIFGTDPFNKDTDGDGYIDGDEIATGTDALNPFDGSSVNKSIGTISKNPNLTDRLMNLTMANMVDDSGNLDPERIDETKYADILQSINNEAMMFLIVPPPTDSEMRITNDNSKQAIEKYLNAASTVIEEGLISSMTASSKEISEVSGVSPSYSTHYQKTFDSLRILEVPSSWKEIQRSALVLFKQLENSFGAMTNVDEDPIKSSFALQQVQDSYLQMINLLNQTTKLAQEQGIQTQDSLFQMMQTINTSFPQN